MRHDPVAAARAARALLILFEVLLKLIIGLVTGFGVALLVFGLLIYLGPGIELKDFSRGGLPPAESCISAGAGLLTTAFVLLVLFVGPVGRRRWFVPTEKSDQDSADGSAEMS